MAGTAHSREYRQMIASLVGLRNRRGVSQAALARRIGRPPSYIAKIELCERRVDVIELMVLLRALDAEVADFLAGAVPVVPGTIPR